MTIYAVVIDKVAQTARLLSVEATPRVTTLIVPRIAPFNFAKVIPAADAKTDAADAIWCASSQQQQKVAALREELKREEAIQASIDRLNPATPTPCAG